METPERAAPANPGSPSTGPQRKSKQPSPEKGQASAHLMGCRDPRSGQVLLLPAEEFKQYGIFISGFHNDLAPVGAVERQLAQVMAENSWKLNRASAGENFIMALGFQLNAAAVDPVNPPQVIDSVALGVNLEKKVGLLNQMSQYQTRAWRVFERAQQTLAKIQNERKEREKIEMRYAALLLQKHEAEETERQAKEVEAKPELPPSPKRPYNPAADGFVFSLAQVKSYVFLERRNQDARDFEKSLTKDPEDDGDTDNGPDLPPGIYYEPF